MKKIIALFMIMPGFLYGNSQVITSLQIPQEGLSIKSQLWNAILTNTGNTTITIKINLSFTDLSNGQQVFSAVTGTIDLPVGSTNITPNNILPISYTVLNYGYNIDQSPDGFLPIGNFTICYQILKQNDETFDEISNECETTEIEPVSPPYLNTPEDQVEIEETNPLFSWIPPAPVSLFVNLNYTYTLVEVLQGQSSPDAIQQNVPILQQNNIAETVLQYPVTSQSLDTGKTYAWQIIANSNNLPVSMSEVWSFKLKTPVVEPVKNTSLSFVKLGQIDAIPVTVCSDFLRYEYLNESNDSLASIGITDITSNDLEIITNDNAQQKIQLGQNSIEMDLRDLGLKAGHYYLFQLTGNNNEKLYVKFQYLTN